MPMQDLALDLCRALVRCRSVTPDDGGALNVLALALDKAGFATQRLTFSEPGTPDVANLYARIGTGAPYLVFAGHTDVVPVGDAGRWRFDPFAAELADGAIWGRGTADMKGGVAAFAAAACAYAVRHGSTKARLGFSSLATRKVLPSMARKSSCAGRMKKASASTIASSASPRASTHLAT